MTEIPNFDPNQWYWMKAEGLPTSSNYLSYEFVIGVSIKEIDTSWQWQVLQFNSTVWVIRCHSAGANYYLGTFLDSSGQTLFTMVLNQTADASVYWEITSQGDGSWALGNLLGPPTLYKRQDTEITVLETLTSISSAMETSTGGAATLTSVETFPEPTVPANARWFFESKSVSAINDADFSSIYLPDSSMTISDTSALASATSYPTSPDYTAPPGSSHTYSPGLSTTIKAAIGAGVGIAVLIGLLLVGFCLRRKRKQRQASEISEPELQNHNFLPSTNNDLKYNTETVYEVTHNNVEMDAPVYYDQQPAIPNDYKIPQSNVELSAPTDPKPKHGIHELPHNDVASEAPAKQRPVELPTVVCPDKHELE